MTKSAIAKLFYSCKLPIQIKSAGKLKMANLQSWQKSDSGSNIKGSNNIHCRNKHTHL